MPSTRPSSLARSLTLALCALAVAARVDAASEVEVLPKPVLALRAFRWEAGAKVRSVELVNSGSAPLEILGVQGVDPKRFAVDVTPVEAGARYRVTARLLPDGPTGMAQSGLQVKTNKGDVGIMVLTL